MITFLMNLHFFIASIPWSANIDNFLDSGFLPAHLDTQDKIKFFSDVQNFYWDDPYLFKYYPDQIFQKYIPNNEVCSVIKFYHLRHMEIISRQKRRLQKSYNVDFIGPPCSKTHMHSAKPVKIIKRWDLFQSIESLYIIFYWLLSLIIVEICIVQFMIYGLIFIKNMIDLVLGI